MTHGQRNRPKQEAEGKSLRLTRGDYATVEGIQQHITTVQLQALSLQKTHSDTEVITTIQTLSSTTAEQDTMIRTRVDG